MKLTKNQLKTWNSQQSDIDMFSKMQTTFLQKFFRLNLIDYFDDIVTNMYQLHPNKKNITKSNKSLLNYLFRVEKCFMAHELEQKIHSFYKQRAKSFESGELQHIFKIRYCNWSPVPNLFKKGEVILVDVKIKAEIERLETLPLKLIETLETTCKSSPNQPDDQHLKQTFKHYPNEYMNIFIIYFGDINFHVVSKTNYSQQSITLYNKQIKLRIFTFFVSKQALLQTFRSMNNITSLDHINDLAIQYYEVKREKRRQKKINKKQIDNRKCEKIVGNRSFIAGCLEKVPEKVKFIMFGGIGLAAVCLAGYKWFAEDKIVQKV